MATLLPFSEHVSNRGGLKELAGVEARGSEDTAKKGTYETHKRKASGSLNSQTSNGANKGHSEAFKGSLREQADEHLADEHGPHPV